MIAKILAAVVVTVVVTNGKSCVLSRISALLSFLALAVRANYHRVSCARVVSVLKLALVAARELLVGNHAKGYLTQTSIYQILLLQVRAMRIILQRMTRGIKWKRELVGGVGARTALYVGSCVRQLAVPATTRERSIFTPRSAD